MLGSHPKILLIERLYYNDIMNIQLLSDDLKLMQTVRVELDRDLEQNGLAGEIQAGELEISTRQDTVKGAEVVTLASILLTAAGAGGALAVAMDKDGFLTALVRLLEKCIERRIEVTVVDKKGKKIKLAGPAGQIRKMLKELKE